MSNTKFLNLRGTLKQSNISVEEVASLMGVSRFTYNSRLTKITKWKLDEMILIKTKINEKLGTDYTLEYLFKE